MIGRIAETQLLTRLFNSDESEFVAVYGRRRVGKTYLIRETFEDRFSFIHTGLPCTSTRKQLSHFLKSLKDYGYAGRGVPKDWFEAFDMLKTTVSSRMEKRKVIFIDELPWMDSSRSDFLIALEAFWNEWASPRKDILFIVCGSASSWIVNRLFKDKGGLHNRITARILLKPFTLHECELYLQSRGIEMTRNDIAECYMALGGIPYYWRLLTKGYSLAQNFDSIFFSDSAPLKGEFTELYASLFRNAPIYMKIVSALATRKAGMTRLEMTHAANLPATGVVSEALEALEESGFIRRYSFFGKKKRESVYQLIDNFTLFHFRFLDNATMDRHFWTNTLSSPSQAAWRGLAFERLCLQHSEQMRKALGIAGVHTEIYAWRHVGDAIYPKGAQIDLILDRADNVINICEMKYTKGRYLLDKDSLEELNEKAEVFSVVSKTRKAMHLTMVTANGLVDNAYSKQIQSEITLADLFSE